MSACYHKPDKTSTRTYAILAAAWIASLYLFLSFGLYQVFDAQMGFFFVQPLLWVSLAVLSLFGYLGLLEKPAFDSRLLLWAVLAGLLQPALFFLAGFFFQFGFSPYGRDGATLVLNMLNILTLTLGFEMSRAFLGAALGARRPYLALVLVTLLLTLISFTPGQYSLLDSPASSLKFIGQLLLPCLAKNLLATFLAMSAGPLVSIGYMGSLALMEWFPPVLPDLPWLVTAVLGTAIPILTLSFFNKSQLPTRRSAALESKAGPEAKLLAQKRAGGALVWVLVGGVALGLLGFSTGLFGPQPFLVNGGSMNPALYAGDIVVTTPVPLESLAVGDVIRFHRNGVAIVHRIVEIQQGPVFITRGDNNPANDAPVYPEELDGKTTLVIPKVGWVALGFRSILSLLGGGG